MNPRPSALLLILFFLLAACGPVAQPSIVRVTPLPAGQPTPAASAPPTPAANDPLATPTPLSVVLPQGEAAAIAAATDIAVKPTPRNQLFFDSYPAPITFDEFYDGYDMRAGLRLSDKLVSLDGQQVVMEGYMAPPLKPALDYFVLTRIRLEFCPFCTSTADWPDDIALVYMQAEEVTATTQPIRLQGRLEVGASVDAETGMVSLVRIYAHHLEVIQ